MYRSWQGVCIAYVWLGFTLNFEKLSLLHETQKLCIAYIISTVTTDGQVWIHIPRTRIHKLKHDIRRVVRRGFRTERDLASIAGQCVAMSKAIIPAKLFLRNIYHLLRTKRFREDILCLDSALQNMLWWSCALDYWNGEAAPNRVIDIQVPSDAWLINRQISVSWQHCCSPCCLRDNVTVVALCKLSGRPKPKVGFTGGDSLGSSTEQSNHHFCKISSRFLQWQSRRVIPSSSDVRMEVTSASVGLPRRHVGSAHSGQIRVSPNSDPHHWIAIKNNLSIRMLIIGWIWIMWEKKRNLLKR